MMYMLVGDPPSGFMFDLTSVSTQNGMAAEIKMKRDYLTNDIGNVASFVVSKEP